MQIRNIMGLFLCLAITVGIAGCSRPEPTPMPDQSSVNTQADADQQMPKEYEWEITPSPALQAGKPITLNFDIAEKLSHEPLGELINVHEKMVHLIIVSKDLKYFTHIHPDIKGLGQMQVETQFPKEGKYVMYLQFTPAGGTEQTLSQSVQVGKGQFSSARLVPDTEKSKQVDGYTFRMTNTPTQVGKAAMVTLAVENDGMPVANIEPYLGAGGHAVLLSEDAESFLHVHPMTEAKGRYYQSPLQFHTQVNQPGLYKMWIQTQINGQVHTVDFTFQVR